MYDPADSEREREAARVEIVSGGGGGQGGGCLMAGINRFAIIVESCIFPC